jgi:divalent metal cation (Fe/Co/Zn/Cd) transporter
MELLGLKKIPLARKLHNKVLYTDAEAQKANWMTSAAAIVGVIGTGAGLWWTDALAAIFISADIIKDGYSNLKGSVFDLMDRIPQTVDRKKPDRLNYILRDKIRKHEWVKDARIRLREQGNVFFGEVFILPSDTRNITDKIEKLGTDLKNVSWKIHDITITVVKEL